MFSCFLLHTGLLGGFYKVFIKSFFIIFQLGFNLETFSFKQHSGDIFQCRQAALVRKVESKWNVKGSRPSPSRFMFINCPSYHFPALLLLLKLSQDHLAMFPLGWKHIYSECLLWSLFIISAPKEVNADGMKPSQPSFPSLPVSLLLSLHRDPRDREISDSAVFIPTEGATWLPTAISPFFLTNKLWFYCKRQYVLFSKCGQLLFPASQGDA